MRRLAQIFDHGGHDRVATIRTSRLFDRDMSDGALIFAPKWTHVEIGLKFAEMLPACFFAPRVTANSAGSHPICAAMKVEHIGGRRFVDAEHTAGKPQIGEVHGKSEPIGGAPPLADQRQVLGRERVMPHDRRRVGRRIEQRRARLRREDFVFLHAASFAFA